MSIEDIEKLKEKLNKDPNSKLFVPLAEEYKKAGMLDEAVDILTRGLESQPTYLSARVCLGKIYVERGMLDEAKNEFEKVISVIPDNLYAHKKLAEIYKSLGWRDEAIKELKTVMRLNPLDDWASTSLSSMEEESLLHTEIPPVIKPEEISPSEKEEEEIFLSEEEQLETGQETPLDASFTVRDLELTKIISEEAEEERGREEELPEISPGTDETGSWDVPLEAVENVEEEPAAEHPGGEEIESWELPSEPVKEIKGEDIIPPKTAISEEDMELWRAHLEGVGETDVKGEEVEEEVEPIKVEELPEEEPISFEDILNEPAASVQEGFVEEPASIAETMPVRSVDEADKWILRGKYGEAMGIYRAILSRDPGNKPALQRVEELRVLLKLLGKDKEELIKTLEGFLGAIKKRRDEFSGTA